MFSPLLKQRTRDKTFICGMYIIPRVIFLLFYTFPLPFFPFPSCLVMRTNGPFGAVLTDLLLVHTRRTCVHMLMLHECGRLYLQAVIISRRLSSSWILTIFPKSVPCRISSCSATIRIRSLSLIFGTQGGYYPRSSNCFLVLSQATMAFIFGVWFAQEYGGLCECPGGCDVGSPEEVVKHDTEQYTSTRLRR